MLGGVGVRMDGQGSPLGEQGRSPAYRRGSWRPEKCVLEEERRDKIAMGMGMGMGVVKFYKFNPFGQLSHKMTPNLNKCTI